MCAFFEDVKAAIPCEENVIKELPLLYFHGVFYSWNNCIVEITTISQKVYLPDFRAEDDESNEQLNPVFDVLQEAVEQVYESHGFEVVWIGPGNYMRQLARCGGGLHCITKVLRRLPL